MPKQFLMIPFLVSTTVAGIAQSDESSEVATSPLLISIESSAHKIVLCQPLALKLVVTNKTERIVETYFPLAALECLYVQHDGGPFQKWRRAWIQPGCLAGKPIAINPGESREYFVELVWQKKYAVLDKVGDYRIKADWNDASGRFTAYCDVEVEEGSQREKQCLARLRREDLLGWLGFESDYVIALEIVRKRRSDWRADLERLFRIAKEYSDTRYSKYCLCTVLNTIDSSYLRRAKAESVDDEFRVEVVRWAEQRCAQQTDARTLYSYASYLYRQDKNFHGTLRTVQKLLRDANALKPDVVLKQRIVKLGFKAQIDLRKK